MGVVPALLNYQLLSKKPGKSYGGKKSLINLGRMWSSLGNGIWKHRFSKLGQLPHSALESRHSGFPALGEVGGPGRDGADGSSGVYQAYVVLVREHAALHWLSIFISSGNRCWVAPGLAQQCPGGTSG